MGNPSKIKFENVTKEYPSARALDHVNLKIPNHKIFVIVGPSGSGKSTLLKLINRLIVPTSGRILLDGKNIDDYPVKRLRMNMGNLLQEVALFPNLTVDQNVAIQLKISRVARPKRIELAKRLLKEVGLSAKYGARLPKQLSGGEQQRVGVARALATRPELILMDEPFSALDPINRQKLQDLVLTLHRKLRNTIVFVTHDMHEALKMGDQIAVLYQGRIIQVGTADDLLRNPRSPLVNKLFHQRSVRDLVNRGYAKPIGALVSSPVISVNQSIPRLAEALNDDSQVNVRYHDRVWQINVSDFLDFIGRRKDNRHE